MSLRTIRALEACQKGVKTYLEFSPVGGSRGVSEYVRQRFRETAADAICSAIEYEYGRRKRAGEPAPKDQSGRALNPGVPGWSDEQWAEHHVRLGILLATHVTPLDWLALVDALEAGEIAKEDLKSLILPQ